jgi:hypothetical protein
MAAARRGCDGIIRRRGDRGRALHAWNRPGAVEMGEVVRGGMNALFGLMLSCLALIIWPVDARSESDASDTEYWSNLLQRFNSVLAEQDKATASLGPIEKLINLLDQQKPLPTGILEGAASKYFVGKRALEIKVYNPFRIAHVTEYKFINSQMIVNLCFEDKTKFFLSKLESNCTSYRLKKTLNDYIATPTKL